MNWGVFALCFVSLIAIASCAGKNRRQRTMNTDISFKPEENEDQFFSGASFKKTKRRYRLRIDDSDEDSFQPIRKKPRIEKQGQNLWLKRCQNQKTPVEKCGYKRNEKKSYSSKYNLYIYISSEVNQVW
ncbi:hypothetical protein TNIN_26481 [Trichonephila inaurata madagascariensis]|uniref:Uncharacterized protein n=1 Tax=Trichonephila inaurata madagascariensis TaxID=2747483 RepID=A0A8X6YJG2_9ARAC|nr:hypothetical protein TNIN_26481 [Trichonephila inaurata madagascariensis]